jgi:serine/threonine-protein kinase
LPHDDALGACPDCTIVAHPAPDHDMNPPGASQSEQVTIGFEPVVAAGALEALAQSIGPIPRVVLPSTRPDDAGVTVSDPGSLEMPALGESSDRYQFFGEIARGGMGAILKGRDANLGRDLAVKVLLEAHADKPDLLRRFVEEAQIGGQLQHPGIVPVYELGAFADGRPYFTMKLVKGRTLATLLNERGSARASTPGSGTPSAQATGLASGCEAAERGSVSAPHAAPDARAIPSALATGVASDLPRFLGIFEQVAQTMAYAHARSVIHRDLKPSNIMVGSFGEVQVMDWGLAKVLRQGGVPGEEPDRATPVQVSVIRTLRSESDSDASRSGSVVGTPAYMAPEQADGDVEQIDQRVDVFGLGSILCEILTGHPAYTGRTSQEVMRMALRGDTATAFARLDTCAADLELVALAKDCLACEPQDRPSDANAVATRITAYLTGVQARLHLAELAQVEALARAEEEAKRRVLSDQLAAEAHGRADEAHRREQLELQRRRYQVGLAGAALLLSAVGGLSFTYWIHERQAHSARAELALKEATLLRSQAARTPEDVARWEAAARQVDAASGALAESGHAETARRLSALQKEVQTGLLAARRDRTLLDALTDVVINEQDLGDSGTDAGYSRAFREAGLDVDNAPPAEVGATLKRRPASVVLAATAALDDWALVRSRGSQPTDRERRPLEVARAADTDLYRDKVRAAILEADPKAREAALRKLAAEPEAVALPPASAVLLASALRKLKALEPAVAVLRAVADRHPQDVWANYVLADTLDDLKPPAREEAVRYFTAARSLRPETAHRLAHLLDEMGRGAEALAVFADLVGRRPDDACNLGCYGACLKERGSPEAAAILDRAIDAARGLIRLRPDDGHARFHLGLALGARGKADEAIAAYREAIRVEPDDSLAHYNLAYFLQGQGKLPESNAEFREAIRLKPDDADGYRGLGYTLTSQGKLDEAIVELRKAIRLKPDFALAHDNLGYALEAQGNLKESIAEYREAIRYDPNDAWAYSKIGAALLAEGKPAEAVDACRIAVRLKPDDADAHGTLSNALEALGKLDEAMAELRAAVQRKPDSAQAHRSLGYMLSSHGNADEAISELRAAIRLKPDYALAHTNLGYVLANQGNVDEAVAECREAVRLEPNDAPAHTNLGAILCDNKHDYDGAIAEFREAIRLKPDYADAHHNLGVALKAQGRQDEAIAAYREALRIKPGYLDARVKLGRTLQGKGKFEEAVAEFREMVRATPDSAIAHDNLGYALHGQGKLKEAIAEYREAIRLDPKDAWAYYTLGSALLADNKPAEAVAACRAAIRLKPDDADGHFNLGNALRRQGELDQAAAAYGEVIRLQSGHGGAHHNLAHVLSDLGKDDDALGQFREVVRLAPEQAEPYFDMARTLNRLGDYAAALAMYRKGHELGSKQPNWQLPSAQWLADAERTVALASRLPAVLQNQDKPKNPAEGLAFARMAYDRKSFAAAAQLWAGALEADPKLVDDRQAAIPYDAACAASLAAAGAGKDEPPLTDAQRAKLRQQALAWLKAERDLWAKILESGKPENRATVVETLEHWREDSDLASVRDPAALAKLPEGEQKAWVALWQEVDSLLKKGRATPR